MMLIDFNPDNNYYWLAGTVATVSVGENTIATVIGNKGTPEKPDMQAINMVVSAKMLERLQKMKVIGDGSIIIKAHFDDETGQAIMDNATFDHVVKTPLLDKNGNQRKKKNGEPLVQYDVYCRTSGYKKTNKSAYCNGQTSYYDVTENKRVVKKWHFVAANSEYLPGVFETYSPAMERSSNIFNEDKKLVHRGDLTHFICKNPSIGEPYLGQDGMLHDNITYFIEYVENIPTFKQ